jgi:small subunit ribosomal protein S4
MSRRVGVSICGEEKDAVRARAYPPGQHGHKGYPRMSDYSRQLREKQKVCTIYFISDKTLANAYKATVSGGGNTINTLVALLESRLDAVLVRGGLVVTVQAAKQMISHKHVMVNGKIVNVRSYRVRPGDVVSIKPASFESMYVLAAIERGCNVPDYLETDSDKRSVTMLRLPASPAEVPYAVELNFNLILSFFAS